MSVATWSSPGGGTVADHSKQWALCPPLLPGLETASRPFIFGLMGVGYDDGGGGKGAACSG